MKNSKKDAATEEEGDSISVSEHDEDDDRRSEAETSDSRAHTDEETIATNLAASETKNIQKLKFIVVLVILFAVACAIGVYFYVRNQEKTNFETQAQEDALKVLSSLGDALDFSLGGINALSVNMVSYAEDTNKTWPFVTFPHFGVRAGKFLSLSKSFIIGIFMYVSAEDRLEWEAYTAQHGKKWLNEVVEVQKGNPRYVGPIPENATTWNVIFDETHYATGPGETGTSSKGPHMPIWQGVPQVTTYAPYNWDLIALDKTRPDIDAAMATHKISIGRPYLLWDDPQWAWDARWASDYIDPAENVFEPVSDMFFPVVAESAQAFNLWEDTRLDDYDPDDYTFVGMIGTSMYWRELLRNILPLGSIGIVISLSNPCGQPFTYQINGPDTLYLGPGDLIDPKYDHLMIESNLADLAEFALRDSGYSGPPLNHEVCPYRVKVSASETMENDYTTNNPIIFSVTAGIIFVVFACMFFIYDWWIEKRNRLVMDRAERSGAIVSSMFPESITRRLMEAQRPAGDEGSARSMGSSSFVSAKGRVKSFLKDEDNTELDKPIADLFINTTVYFADIQGFTAWSSSRDPSQVFVLLETIFKEFDLLAKRRRVFKVETVGDCFVAVTGLPEPQEKHALIMARFAWDSLMKFSILTRELETKLGPDTADLALRCGLHSGPVTAGVLRGDRARFQLFGDTVNTAARMESTGAANKIQVSNATANCLIADGKKHWLIRREDSVVAKGKGVVATYWLALYEGDGGASVQSGTSDNIFNELPEELLDDGAVDAKRSRLIDWIVRLLQEHIHAIMARQLALGVKHQDPAEVVFTRNPGETCLDEVMDVIKLPKFNARAAADDALASQVEVPAVVIDQLEKLVTVLASTYRENEFHNFEHACHVTMSVDKFLRRIVNPDDMELDDDAGVASTLHDYTHGINSDPLTIMAIVFSALIHDSDHRGVSNMQLCKEDENMAKTYRSKSVAEQNSLDLSWAVLMDNDFKDLRACIFANEVELLRFRQVVVNVVLATDIFDKELNDLRKARWNRAFDETIPMDQEYFVDTRATIVIEHIMQASDVSHTMQHWHIYRKWNERLFAEMTCAFRVGRMGKDPATFWYKGEIGFFDNYIIPLAKKLKECRVFGVSSDECLNYAEKNRAEWEQSGQEVVAELIEKYRDYKFHDVTEDAMAASKIVDV